MKKFKDISYSKDFEVLPGQTEYEFRMKKRSYWWIWVLGVLLFLALCCIRCERTIEVTTIDADTGEKVVCDSVELTYVPHYLIDGGRLFVDEGHVICQAPDSDGVVRFEYLPCSVFSYIFFPLEKVEYEVRDNEYKLKNNLESSYFNFTWSKRLEVVSKLSASSESEDEIEIDSTPDSLPVEDNIVEYLEPCNASNKEKNNVTAGFVSSPYSYNMGMKSGYFDFSWDNGGRCPDKIDIYNHNPEEPYDIHTPIFTTGMVIETGSETIYFSNGSVITIIVTTGEEDGSLWKYDLSCPEEAK